MRERQSEKGNSQMKDIETAAGQLEELGDDIRWLDIMSRDQRKAVAARLTPELLDGALRVAYDKLSDTLFPRDDSDYIALDQAALMRDRVASIIAAVRWCGLAQYRWPELDRDYSFSDSEAYRKLEKQTEEFDQALGQAVSREACMLALGWRFADDPWHWIRKL